MARMKTIEESERDRHDWIDRRLGQLGIDVRQSGHHSQMRFYLEQLKKEIQYTEDFMREDGA